MISFCGVPIVEYCIRYLKENGITDIIVIVGPKKSPIMDYITDGKLFGVNIAYVVQDKPLGLGHSLLTVENYIDDENFVLLLGDTIFMGNNDMKEMIEKHLLHRALVTILLERTQLPERYGVAKLVDNRIISSLYEKPTENKIKEEFKINNGWLAIAGLYVLNKNVFYYLKRTEKDMGGEVQLTDAFKIGLSEGNTVIGHILNGKRIDVGAWTYLKEEKDFYSSMTEEELEAIIKARNEKLKLKGGFL